MSKKLEKLFGTDETKVEEGIWVPLGDGSIEVKIRRLNSKFSQGVKRDLERPYKNILRHGELPEKTAEELSIKHIAKAVLIDWKGVEDDDDARIEPTEKNKIAILTKYPDLTKAILAASIDRDLFAKEDLEDAEGNSSPN